MEDMTLTKPAAYSPSALRLSRIPLIESLGKYRAELFRAPRIFTPQACREVIEHTDRTNRPSTVAYDNGDAGYRTSTSSDFPNDLPVAAHLADMISRLLDIPVEYAESMQAQRYEVGQEFKPHCDWFQPGSESYAEHCSVSGQRTWTAMAYMNDVEEGGETTFPRLGVAQKPEQGTLLMWNNLTSEGKVNPWTIHHAMPVGKGRKYVVTLWFRERPWR